MRRKDREITNFQEIIEIMKSCQVCHVAFRSDDYPYVVPMNFGMAVEDGNVILYFHGANLGKKHDLIKKDNRVGFVMECSNGIITNKNSADACDCTMEYESVMGTGVIEYVPESRKVEALHTILKQYQVSGKDFDEKNLSITTVLQLMINSLSAKRRKVGRL